MKSGRNGPETEKAKDINACTVTISQSVRRHDVGVTHWLYPTAAAAPPSDA